MTDIPKEIQTGDPPDVNAIESYTIGVYSLDILAPIPAMQSRTVYFYAPVGKVIQVKALNVMAQAIPGGFASVHDIEVFAPGDIPILFGSAPFNTAIGYQYMRLTLGAATHMPAQEISQGMALDSLIANVSNPITFVYYNWTAGVQNSNVTIRVVTREGVY